MNIQEVNQKPNSIKKDSPVKSNALRGYEHRFSKLPCGSE